MTLAYVPVDGPPEAIVCPVVLCDWCGDLIDAQRKGIVLWAAEGRTTTTVAHVHKGACDRSFEAARPEVHWLWDDVGDWLEQLTRNTQRPSAGIEASLTAAPPKDGA